MLEFSVLCLVLFVALPFFCFYKAIQIIRFLAPMIVFSWYVRLDFAQTPNRDIRRIKGVTS